MDIEKITHSTKKKEEKYNQKGRCYITKQKYSQQKKEV